MRPSEQIIILLGGVRKASGYTLVAATGAFVFTGDDMQPLAGYSLPSSLGAFSLTGIDAGLIKQGRILTADQGAFVFTGIDANLVKTSPATTFDPANSGANQVLSNGNLTVTASATVNQMARSVASHTSGKYYHEVTIGSTAVNIGVGYCTSAAPVGSQYTGNGATSVGTFGASWLQCTGTTTAAGRVAGRTYGVAIDLTNKLIWIKDITGGGNWNGNGTADPATGVNGAIPNWAGGSTVFAAVTCGNSGDNLTANFGATAYAGTPPSGYGNW